MPHAFLSTFRGLAWPVVKRKIFLPMEERFITPCTSDLMAYFSVGGRRETSVAALTSCHDEARRHRPRAPATEAQAFVLRLADATDSSFVALLTTVASIQSFDDRRRIYLFTAIHLTYHWAGPWP